MLLDNIRRSTNENSDKIEQKTALNWKELWHRGEYVKCSENLYRVTQMYWTLLPCCPNVLNTCTVLPQCTEHLYRVAPMYWTLVPCYPNVLNTCTVLPQCTEHLYRVAPMYWTLVPCCPNVLNTCTVLPQYQDRRTRPQQQHQCGQHLPVLLRQVGAGFGRHHRGVAAARSNPEGGGALKIWVK